MPDARAGRGSCIPDLDRRRGAARGCGSRSSTSAPRRARTRSPRGASARTRSSRAAERLTERRFDALHFEGPGTDLTRRAAADVAVGWRRGSRPSTASSTCPTSRPRRSSPRPTRSASTASCARRSRSCSAARSSAASRSSSEGGRAVRIEADEGADVLRGYAERDEGASRLGEVALVDGEGRIGPLGHRLLRHAARRERGEPHRARPGLRVHGAARRTATRVNNSRDPRRLHDRRPERRRRRASPRRRARARPARRRLARW